MIEMELKARISDKERIIKTLESSGCVWSEEIRQADTIYLNREDMSMRHVPVFRIRRIDNQIILTMKIQAEDLNTAKELELQISDEETMHQILNSIGYDVAVKVDKKRRETQYHGYTICIDEVEYLGDFIEIEKLSETDDRIDAEYRAMMQELEMLGIKQEQLVKEKYFEMLNNIYNS